MDTVKIHSCYRQQDQWKGVINGLRLAGLKVYKEPQEAEISLVLSGKHENPTLLKGHKVIAFDAEEWIKFMAPPQGWIAYKKVLDEYYDEFLNLTGMSDAEKVQAVKAYHEAH